MLIEDGVLVKVTPREAKGHFVIPNGVTSIGNQAFWGCTGLTDITIPDGVKRIGEYAFFNCTGLTDITIPNSVTSIGWEAFCGCYNLTSVTIPDSIKRIEEYAFFGCKSLKSKIANYKAFGITFFGKLKCLNKIYKEGRKSFVKGEIALCGNGIHYCTNLYEIFNYYAGEIDNVIAIYECDVSDNNIGEEVTSKRCAKWIIPRKRLYREDVIRILNGGE